MDNHFLDDQELVKSIRIGGSKRKQALKQIYMNRNLHERIFRMVKKQKGTIQDAEDMIHDAMIIADRNIRQDRFNKESSIFHYVFSICRLLWMNQVRKRSHATEKQDKMKKRFEPNEGPEAILLTKEKKLVFDRLLAQLDEQCQRILNLWKQSYSMQEIANQIGLSSPAMAKKYRYRCKQKLIKLLEADTELQLVLNDLR